MKGRGHLSSKRWYRAKCTVNEGPICCEGAIGRTRCAAIHVRIVVKLGEGRGELFEVSARKSTRSQMLQHSHRRYFSGTDGFLPSRSRGLRDSRGP